MADYIALSTENVDAPDVNQESASEALLFGRGSSRSTSYGGSVTILSDSQGYTYSYGPGGLSGLIHNYYALGCAVFASIGGM
jgi:hypothetical protein